MGDIGVNNYIYFLFINMGSFHFLYLIRLSLVFQFSEIKASVHISLQVYILLNYATVKEKASVIAINSSMNFHLTLCGYPEYGYPELYKLAEMFYYSSLTLPKKMEYKNRQRPESHSDKIEMIFFDINY